MENSISKKEKSKGRSKGGMLMGIEKSWESEILCLGEKREEGLHVTSIVCNNKTINLWSV